MNRIEFNLEGTTTVITGGSSGIGLATAELVAKSGGNVIVSESRTPEKTAHALERIRNARSNPATEVLAFPYEASDEASVAKFFETVRKVGRRVDYVIHGVAISPDTAFEQQTAALWNRVHEVNSTGTFLAVQNAWKIMKDQAIVDEVRGKILLITSTNGIDSYGSFSAPYDDSKGGNNTTVRNLGEKLHKDYQITVNGLAPGWVDTGMNDTLTPEDRALESAKIWSGRWATPEELAMNAIAMLVLPYKSGRVDMVDGGYR